MHKSLSQTQLENKENLQNKEIKNNNVESPLSEKPTDEPGFQRKKSCDESDDQNKNKKESDKVLKLSQSVIIESRNKVEDDLKPKCKKEVVIIENPRVTKHINSNTSVEMEDLYIKPQPQQSRYLYHTKDNYNSADPGPHHFATQPDLRKLEERKVNGGDADITTSSNGYAYICINCLNRGFCNAQCNAKRKEQEEKENDRQHPQTSNRNQHISVEKFKVLNRTKQIQERETLAKEIGSGIKRVDAKENCAKKLSEKEYSLNDNKKKDFYKEKAKTRDKNIDTFCKTYIQKFDTSDTKPRVTEYYKSCYEYFILLIQI